MLFVHQTHEGRTLPYASPSPQCPAQGLAHSRAGVGVCWVNEWRDPPRASQSPSPDYWCRHRDSTFRPCPCSRWLDNTACCFRPQCIQRSHYFCRQRGRCKTCWKNFPHTLKMIMERLPVKRRWEGFPFIAHQLWAMLCVGKGNSILKTLKQLLGDVIISTLQISENQNHRHPHSFLSTLTRLYCSINMTLLI